MTEGTVPASIPEEKVSLRIPENKLVILWDTLNETAMNAPADTFRAQARDVLGVLEEAMTEAGLKIPKSSNGHA